MADANQNMQAVLEREEIGAGWPWKIFIFTIIVFGTVLASYFGLKLGYRPYLNARIADIDAQITALGESVPEAQQHDLFRFYSQILNLKELLDKHVSLAKFFALLEKNTNKKVAYETANLTTQRRELALDGVADSYATLSEQLEAFRQVPEIQSLVLSQSQLAEGKVRFRISAILAPALLH